MVDLVRCLARSRRTAMTARYLLLGSSKKAQTVYQALCIWKARAVSLVRYVSLSFYHRHPIHSFPLISRVDLRFTCQKTLVKSDSCVTRPPCVFHSTMVAGL